MLIDVADGIVDEGFRSGGVGINKPMKSICTVTLCETEVGFYAKQFVDGYFIINPVFIVKSLVLTYFVSP